MNVESQKTLCLTCFVGFIALIVIIIIFCLRSPEPKVQAEDPHRVTLKYDEQGTLRFEDAQGNLIEPTVLTGDPIRAVFKNRIPKEIGGVPAVIFDVRFNPKCRPIIISGNLCVAPHSYCCQAD